MGQCQPSEPGRFVSEVAGLKVGHHAGARNRVVDQGSLTGKDDG
jgi:hypothetical protein